MNVLAIGNKRINLPKLTLGVKEAIDSINQNNASDVVSDRDKYQAMLDFVVQMIGEDQAKGIFETLDINEIDLPTIKSAFLGICDAFDRPEMENEMKRRNDKLNAMLSSDTMKKFNEILKVADAAKRFSSDPFSGK